MHFERKLYSLKLLLELIKNSDQHDDIDGMIKEARAIIREIQQYFFVVQLYSDQTLRKGFNKKEKKQENSLTLKSLYLIQIFFFELDLKASQVLFYFSFI